MATAYQQGATTGVDAKTLEKIREKAERNEPLQSATPAKQQAYDAYQQQYIAKIQSAAQAGQALQAPNDWKNSIYQQAASPQQAQNAGFQQMIQQQQLLPSQQQGMSIQDIIAQSQTNSDAKLQSMQGLLQNSANSQIDSQTALLSQARDKELADLQLAMQEAINQGQLSVKEAEKQYESAKAGVLNQAYTDSELTNLRAHDRGIQNSAQMIGLQQGDNYRRDSLLNQNLTTRDEQINAINNQLEQMKYQNAVGQSQANASYGYGLAAATGQINADMYDKLSGMTWEDYQRIAGQEFGLQQGQINQQYSLEQMLQQQQYAKDNMSQAQQYTQQNMATEQNYTQTNMDKQQGFDMTKLSTQQKYTLEQMAKSFGYDLSKMSTQQQYTLSQMAQSFGYDMNLQSSQQQFQGGQNSLDRNLQVELQSMRQNHDLTMFDSQQQAEFGKYEQELSRKLAQYTPGTDEHELLVKEYDWAIGAMKQESAAKIASEMGATKLAGLLEQYPKVPDMYDAKAVDAYNKQVEALNKQVKAITEGKGFEYTADLLTASKDHTAEEKKGFMDYINGGIKATLQVMQKSFLP